MQNHFKLADPGEARILLAREGDGLPAEAEVYGGTRTYGECHVYLIRNICYEKHIDDTVVIGSRTGEGSVVRRQDKGAKEDLTEQ